MVLAFWKITLAIREQRIDERRQEVQMGTRMVDVGVKRKHWERQDDWLDVVYFCLRGVLVPTAPTTSSGINDKLIIIFNKRGGLYIIMYVSGFWFGC